MSEPLSKDDFKFLLTPISKTLTDHGNILRTIDERTKRTEKKLDILIKEHNILERIETIEKTIRKFHNVEI